MNNTSYPRYKWSIPIFWVIIVLTLFIQYLSVVPFWGAVFVALLFFIVSFFVVTFGSNHLLYKYLKDKNLWTFITVFIVASVFLAVLYMILEQAIRWFEYRRIFPPVMSIDPVRPLYVQFFTYLVSASLINLGFYALNFFDHHIKMISEHNKLKQAHLEGQIHLLNNQLNPHFMFNILNHIHILMKKDVELADKLLLQYSDVLRYQLYECKRNSVLLEREVDFLDNIIAIEKTRWGKELNVVWEYYIEDGKKEISPLLLIPFVENAFKHVSRPYTGIGYVIITLVQKTNTLSLTVENSILQSSRTTENSDSGLGLEIVGKRLQILYPERHRLTVDKTDTYYKTILTISI